MLYVYIDIWSYKSAVNKSARLAFSIHPRLYPRILRNKKKTYWKFMYGIILMWIIMSELFLSHINMQSMHKVWVCTHVRMHLWHLYGRSLQSGFYSI